MKLLLSTLLIATFAFLAGLFLDWWSVAIIAFVVTFFIPQRSFSGFLAGFLGIFLLWAVLATWIDVSNGSLLSEKISKLFPLGGSSFLLILVTAFVGGLVGGFAGMAGSSLRPIKKARR